MESRRRRKGKTGRMRKRSSMAAWAWGGHTSVFTVAYQSQALATTISSIDWHKSLATVISTSY